MKLLVTGAWNYTDEQLNTLKDMGNEILFMQNEKGELPQGAETVEGIIGNGLFLYHDIQQFENLRYIQLTSAGFDRVPMDYVKENNIEIHNARGVYSIPMAELALCGVLGLYKKSRFFFEKQKKHNWEKHRGLIELCGKNVLIVGCGSVGTECAKRFKAFGCEVHGVDMMPYKNVEYKEISTIDKLDEKLSQSDIVVLTLPLTGDTRNLFNQVRFEKMKKDSVLVNIARGAIVNEFDLEAALKDKLLGAVIDVFEKEPLDSESPLWDMENVIITPHNSFVGEGNCKRLFAVIVENLGMWKN